MFVIQQVVKGVVEHADNFAALIADDLVGFLVVECGDCEAAFVVGVLRKVDVAEMGEVGVEGVGRYVFAGDTLVRSGETPACLLLVVLFLELVSLPSTDGMIERSVRTTKGLHTLLPQVPMHTRDSHKILQSLQLPHNQRTMRPRTGIRDV